MKTMVPAAARATIESFFEKKCTQVENDAELTVECDVACYAFLMFRLTYSERIGLRCGHVFNAHIATDDYVSSARLVTVEAAKVVGATQLNPLGEKLYLTGRDENGNVVTVTIERLGTFKVGEKIDS